MKRTTELRVARVMVDADADARHFVVDIANGIGERRGPVAELIHVWLRFGWLERNWEGTADRRLLGQPYYTLTGDGYTELGRALGDFNE